MIILFRDLLTFSMAKSDQVDPIFRSGWVGLGPQSWLGSG